MVSQHVWAGGVMRGGAYQRAAMAVAFIALAGIGAAMAQTPDLETQLAARAERLPLEGRRGPSLFQPGFGVGEYSGWAKSSTQSSGLPGIFSSARASTGLEVQRPGMTPVTGQCAGGQGRIGLGWITFQRDALTYVCTYGGAAPAGAEFDLAESKGGIAGPADAAATGGRAAVRAHHLEGADPLHLGHSAQWRRRQQLC